MTRKLISCCACGVLVLALAAPIAEAGTKRKGAATTGQELPSSQMAPLTAGECQRLGGNVITTGTRNCKSGKICSSDTLNNGHHTVCIDEVG